MFCPETSPGCTPAKVSCETLLFNPGLVTSQSVSINFFYFFFKESELRNVSSWNWIEKPLWVQTTPSPNHDHWILTLSRHSAIKWNPGKQKKKKSNLSWKGTNTRNHFASVPPPVLHPLCCDATAALIHNLQPGGEEMLPADPFTRLSLVLFFIFLFFFFLIKPRFTDSWSMTQFKSKHVY